MKLSFPLSYQLLAVTSWDERWYEAVGFLPYTTQSFMVAVCNMVACMNSSIANGTTLAAGSNNIA